MARTLNIIISKKVIMPRFRNEVYRHSRMAESAENYKQIYNIQAEADNPLDDNMADEFYNNGLHDAMNELKDYNTQREVLENSTQYTFILVLPDTSTATVSEVKQKAEEVIVADMMAQWMMVVMPASVKAFEARKDSAILSLRQIIYHKNPPV